VALGGGLEEWAGLGFYGREVMMYWLGFGDGYEARVVDENG
jgi:hypothetical protein